MPRQGVQTPPQPLLPSCQVQCPRWQLVQGWLPRQRLLSLSLVLVLVLGWVQRRRRLCYCPGRSHP